MGVCKARLLRLLSNFRLFKAADRQQQVRELLLRELIEHVALVLRAALAAQQPVTSARFVIADAGIVPRRDVVKAHLQRAVQKCTEFEAAVAVDARIRRAARAVLADEVIHHLARKKLVLVEDVKRHTETAGNTLRAVRLVAAERQRRARALVALLLQQKRGGGGIHAAAHGDQNFFLHLCPLIQILLQKCLARKRVGHLHERAVEAAGVVAAAVLELYAPGLYRRERDGEE